LQTYKDYALHITLEFNEVLRSKIWETEVQRGFRQIPVKSPEPKARVQRGRGAKRRRSNFERRPIE
jgi:hypothetical protein